MTEPYFHLEVRSGRVSEKLNQYHGHGYDLLQLVPVPNTDIYSILFIRRPTEEELAAASPQPMAARG